MSEGKTAAFRPRDVRTLLDSIPVGTQDEQNLVGLRDRAVIATLVFTAARVGAVTKLRRKDFYTDGHQFFLRLDEKGGKIREIPVRHDLEEVLRSYLAAAGFYGEDSPLFRTAAGRSGKLRASAMRESDVLSMVKRRQRAARLSPGRFTCHSFRATTATNLLDQGVPLEDVQYLLGHSDARSTKLYDRRKRSVTRNIVERISI